MRIALTGVTLRVLAQSKRLPVRPQSGHMLESHVRSPVRFPGEATN